jgi:hypothetical protein
MDSEKVEKFAIVVQCDSRIRQGPTTAAFRCNDFRPECQMAGYVLRSVLSQDVEDDSFNVSHCALRRALANQIG